MSTTEGVRGRAYSAHYSENKRLTIVPSGNEITHDTALPVLQIQIPLNLQNIDDQLNLPEEKGHRRRRSWSLPEESLLAPEGNKDHEIKPSISRANSSLQITTAKKVVEASHRHKKFSLTSIFHKDLSEGAVINLTNKNWTFETEALTENDCEEVFLNEVQKLVDKHKAFRHAISETFKTSIKTCTSIQARLKEALHQLGDEERNYLKSFAKIDNPRVLLKKIENLKPELQKVLYTIIGGEKILKMLCDTERHLAWEKFFVEKNLASPSLSSESFNEKFHLNLKLATIEHHDLETDCIFLFAFAATFAQTQLKRFLEAYEKFAKFYPFLKKYHVEDPLEFVKKLQEEDDLSPDDLAIFKTILGCDSFFDIKSEYYKQKIDEFKNHRISLLTEFCQPFFSTGKHFLQGFDLEIPPGLNASVPLAGIAKEFLEVFRSYLSSESLPPIIVNGRALERINANSYTAFGEQFFFELLKAMYLTSSEIEKCKDISDEDQSSETIELRKKIEELQKNAIQYTKLLRSELLSALSLFYKGNEEELKDLGFEKGNDKYQQLLEFKNEVEKIPFLNALRAVNFAFHAYLEMSIRQMFPSFFNKEGVQLKTFAEDTVKFSFNVSPQTGTFEVQRIPTYRFFPAGVSNIEAAFGSIEAHWTISGKLDPNHPDVSANLEFKDLSFSESLDPLFAISIVKKLQEKRSL